MEKNMKHYNIEQDMRYLQLLSQSFPTIAEASTEIINLQAILNLPKGTEHFLADIHGEYEAFLHVLKNASGNIKRKVNELFGNTLREQEKRELCSLIYYPEQKLELVKQNEPDINDWLIRIIYTAFYIFLSDFIKWENTILTASFDCHICNSETVSHSHFCNAFTSKFQCLVKCAINANPAD